MLPIAEQTIIARAFLPNPARSLAVLLWNSSTAWQIALPDPCDFAFPSCSHLDPTGEAVISDIHANWRPCRPSSRTPPRTAQQIYCLGDLVGYGPDPCHCVDLLRELQVTTVVRGNHDDAVFGQADGLNAALARALRWTKDQSACLAGQPSRRHSCAGLPGNPPLRHAEPDLPFMHGSPRVPA